jgi:hypothetical protein
MKKFSIAAAVSAFAVSSALDQTAVVSHEYYMARDANKKKFTLVGKKPRTTATTIVDNGTYKTRPKPKQA